MLIIGSMVVNLRFGVNVREMGYLAYMARYRDALIAAFPAVREPRATTLSFSRDP